MFRDEENRRKFYARDSSEKTIAIVGDRWWYKWYPDFNYPGTRRVYRRPTRLKGRVRAIKKRVPGYPAGTRKPAGNWYSRFIMPSQYL